MKSIFCCVSIILSLHDVGGATQQGDRSLAENTDSVVAPDSPVDMPLKRAKSVNLQFLLDEYTRARTDEMKGKENKKGHTTETK